MSRDEWIVKKLCGLYGSGAISLGTAMALGERLMSSWDDYYPAGTWGGDPNAPWNQEDPPDCQKCGAALDWEWSYCPYCGEETSKAVYDD